MSERTDNDYAVEHFGYLADAADHLIVTWTTSKHLDDRTEAFQGLESALYEFRKRANRAGLPTTAQKHDLKINKLLTGPKRLNTVSIIS